MRLLRRAARTRLAAAPGFAAIGYRVTPTPGPGRRDAGWIRSAASLYSGPFAMTDSKLQRLNMVESQVRTSDVTDRRIIKAMLEVPREKFVPAALASMAYMDEPVPVGPDNGAKSRALLAPRTFAKLAQLAQIGPEAVVLDVGCATGYSTAVLASLAKRVVAVEVDPGLAQTARRLLADFGASNASVVEGPLAAGAPAEAPFAVIFVNGAVEVVVPPLLR